MGNNKTFVITTDEQTANLLQSEGFEMIGSNNGQWIFINNPQLNFSRSNKIAYTNTLTF